MCVMVCPGKKKSWASLVHDYIFWTHVRKKPILDKGAVGWILSAIYVSLLEKLHDLLWACLQNISKLIQLLGLLIGDLNQVLLAVYKSSKAHMNRNLSARFKSVINACQLQDF